jgi:carbamoyl-phosphate synthase/aspartate carbamoyltransferase/dihydroorotase
MALIKWPGLIDVHVHLREPGATHKEDFISGTKAAVAGGFTAVLDMPNNPVTTVTLERLKEKKKLSEKSLCFVGFHFGTDGTNFAEFKAASLDRQVFGLKIFADHTTGTLLIEDLNLIEEAFIAWKSDKPVLLHAEGEKGAELIFRAVRAGRRVHLCYISRKCEVEAVRKAKAKKLPVTTGVTPHHLFLTKENVSQLGPFGYMKPEVGSDADREALWTGIFDNTIDLVESDHAPHTSEEKKSGQPPFGVPGLETTLGLLLKAVHEGKLSLEKVRTLLYDNPKKAFSVPNIPSRIEFDPDQSFIIGKNGYQTRAGWSPFAGWEAYDRVKRVRIGNKTVYENGSFQV